jgi:acid phosphatase
LRNFGAFLRDKYVSTGKLLPENLDTEQVVFRSTNIVRTIESLQYLIDGMYPSNYRSNDPIHVTVQPRILETYVPSESCPLLTRMVAKKKQAKREELRPELEKILNDLKEINFNNVPISVPEMYDVFAAAVGNNIELPVGITSAQLRTLETLTMKIWYVLNLTKKECSL